MLNVNVIIVYEFIYIQYKPIRSSVLDQYCPNQASLRHEIWVTVQDSYPVASWSKTVVPHPVPKGPLNEQSWLCFELMK